MVAAQRSLWKVYAGWEGYHTSLVHAVAPLTEEQLGFRPFAGSRSVAETVRHIACGRLNWFSRMGASGSAELAARIPEWVQDRQGNRYIVEEALSLESAELIRWLEDTWKMIEATLTEWTVADLDRTYRHAYGGSIYAVSRQWTIWRILSHDMHHGGQLSQMLYQQRIEPLELGSLGGHLTEPPLAEPESPQD